MQCPTCQRDLANLTHCEDCEREAKAFVGTASHPEGNVEPDFADDSNVLSLPEVWPQAADSSEDSSNSPGESETAPVNAPRAQEPAPPTSTVETTVSGNSIDAKGDLSIIGQVNQTIEDMYQTEVRDSKIQAGHDVITAHQVILHGSAQSGKAEEEISLYSLTQELAQRVLGLHESVQIEVGRKVAELKATRLMFITCPYAHFAVDAGHIAVESLKLATSAQNRLLNYEDAARKNIEFSAPKLLEQIPEEKDERAILVYAQSISAQLFLDSIFDTPSRIDHIRAELQRNCLSLIVIVAPQNASKIVGLLKRTSLFAYAEIPFLRPFLRQNYPDDYQRLEADIIAQRARGKWEKEETNFCQQILDLYETEQLEAIVAAGGPDDPKLSAESRLKESDLVEKTVLYAATFFQEITAPEFCRVVETLLDGRTVNAAPQTNGDAHARAETSLLRIWEAEKDHIFNEWLRETSGAKDSVRVVSLSNSALRKPLRMFFEKQHRFYLIDQFKSLENRGVFFHPSNRLAENMTEIAIQMAGSFPDEFNESWVLNLIERLQRHFEFGLADAPDGESDAMFQFLRSSQPGAFNLALSRVSAVLRRMLESPELRMMVQSSLEQLIKGGYHDATLLLVKHLQFTPGFDELYWFKQLLHRANNRTRHLTYYALYVYLKRMNSGAYEVLKKIEAWLPPVERAPATYSQFDYFVLQLLIQYCVETVARFSTAHYGNWPSRYPLFVVKDSEEADERASLLAGWLLHPGIEATLFKMRMGGTRMTLIGALLAEWAFILLGPQGASSVDKSSAPGGNGARTGGVSVGRASNALYSASMLFDLMAWQFASRMNASQRLELLKYWYKLDHDLLKYLVSLPYASGLRSQLSWKRDVVRQLITRIKNQPPADKATATSYNPR
jgi:hypothetical protein